MPAQVVPSPPGCPGTRYAVIGSYSKEAGSRFVQHVALVREDGSIHNEMAGVQVWHMGPPLVAGGHSQSQTGLNPVCKPDVVGWLSLTAEQRDGIAHWLAGVDKEDRPVQPGLQTVKQYTASPDSAHEWHRDEQGRPLFRRFSCASFVLKAYQEGAGVSLIDVSDVALLPEVALNVVSSVYGELAQLPALRRRIDLPGNGPWRVVLAGYVLHALDRPHDQIRVTPHIVRV